MDINLLRIKDELDELSREVSQGKFPAPVLKDFKVSVDQLRLIIWAILTFKDQIRNEAEGGPSQMAAKLFEFRVKRLVQMLNDLRNDIQSHAVLTDEADLRALSGALRAILQYLPG